MAPPQTRNSRSIEHATYTAADVERGRPTGRTFPKRQGSTAFGNQRVTTSRRLSAIGGEPRRQSPSGNIAAVVLEESLGEATFLWNVDSDASKLLLKPTSITRVLQERRSNTNAGEYGGMRNTERVGNSNETNSMDCFSTSVRHASDVLFASHTTCWRGFQKPAIAFALCAAGGWLYYARPVRPESRGHELIAAGRAGGPNRITHPLGICRLLPWLPRIRNRRELSNCFVNFLHMPLSLAR